MSPVTPEEHRFREQRRSALRGSPSVHALDYVESQGHPDGQPVWRLRLRFVSERPEGLGPGNFRLVNPAGEVDPGLHVTRVVLPDDAPGSIDVFVRVTDPKRAERLRTDSATYRLEIDAPGLDRFFSAAPFRFDGRPPAAAPAFEPPGDLPVTGDIDYLAKDYSSFRQVMLERMAAHSPEWTERNPADLGVAIVEVLAYAADYLSYYQDAVATEAYLDTSRKRGSVRRHLRLLGHFLHEGCNARVWVQIRLEGTRPRDLAEGTALLTQAGDLPPVLLDSSVQHTAALEQGSLTFETMHPVRLYPRLNRMPVHSWGAEDYTLPRGATSAALAGHFYELAAGDVLILEQAAPGGENEVDPRRRHAVRLKSKPRLVADPLGPAPITEIEFFDEDALPFALTVSQGGTSAGELVARGNIVLADHGHTLQEELPEVLEGELYRPALSLPEITRRQSLDPTAARARPAAAISQEPNRALPQISLLEIVGDRDESWGEPWVARRDLLESQPFSAHFVAETESDGSVRLRFGDGRQGRKPAPGTRLMAVYRVGNGPVGHIGQSSVGHIVSAEGLPVARVWNPLPAQGSEPPELLERARLIAPRAFRQTESCATPADLSRLAESHPEILRAVAESRWTGSWETLFLFVQRPGGETVDRGLEDRLRAFLEPRLLAGADLEIRSPSPLPLEIHLRGVIEPSAVSEAVRRALLDRLGEGDPGNGSPGYFHSDNFTFAQPVFLDDVLDEAMKVEGVASIGAEVFRPWGSTGEGPSVRSSIEPGPFEIASLRNRPAEPQLGVLTIELEGGS